MDKNQRARICHLLFSSCFANDDFLILVDLIFDLFFYEEPFNFENFLWWDIPINLILSILVAVYSWYFGGKRLQLKSDVIEMDLNETNSRKEK